MTEHTMNRREFVAISAATTACVALSSTAATSNAKESPVRPLRIPSPSLARILPDPSHPGSARLQPIALAMPLSNMPRVHQLADPWITISPLNCISDRLASGASITIEALHPIPNLYSHLLHARNTSINGVCLPDFASTVQTRAPRDAMGQATLRITQRVHGATQSKTITIDTARAGTYLLAVPTAPSASSAAWRWTSARLDESGAITTLTNPLAAASSRCVYLSITIHQHTNEHPIINITDTTGAPAWA